VNWLIGGLVDHLLCTKSFVTFMVNIVFCLSDDGSYQSLRQAMACLYQLPQHQTFKLQTLFPLHRDILLVALLFFRAVVPSHSRSFALSFRRSFVLIVLSENFFGLL
jgi:hypothetical protein